MLRNNVSAAAVAEKIDLSEIAPRPAPREVPRPAPAAAPAPEAAPAPLPRTGPTLAKPATLDTGTLRIDPRVTPRRGMETLRAEALQSVMARVEDRHFGGLRDRVRWRRSRLGTRLALALVALVAGGGAAYLSSQQNRVEAAPAAAVEAPPPPPMAKVLVANEAIGTGARVTVASFGWQDWPEEAVRPGYITETTAPTAPAEMAGMVARSEILPGEPIRAEKLVDGGQSVLASLLAPGMRGVSVAVGADAASGGFVAPRDRVDVVLTRTAAMGQVSETILTNVRVLAINARLESASPAAPPEGEASAAATTAETFGNSAIATLELDQRQAEVLINAGTLGQLSLVLRAAADAGTETAESAANQAIRLTSPFWTTK